jgi:protein AroM
VTRPRIGAVTIGRTPRPDLLAPLLDRAGTNADVIETGALDGLTSEMLAGLGAPRDRPQPDAYPLTTRLRGGSSITVDEAVLEPLVQHAIDRVEDAGVEATLLLCAGGFANVTARGQLVRPFDAAIDRLRADGARRLAVVVPYAGQVEPSRKKWADAGFEPTVLVGEPEAVAGRVDAASADAIVLDYVGHPAELVDAARSRAAVPLIDLGACGADAVVAVLAERQTTSGVAAG